MNTQISTLANGLKIITQERPALETVSIGIWVKTGPACEKLSNNGISHFLEHMSFKGTNARTALQISEEIEDVGGQSNAYTSRECTAYYAKMMKEDAELATDVLIDSVKNSIFPQEELVKERDVVVQEIKQTYDTPDDIVFDYFQETAFPNQALGRSILGPQAKVKKFTREDLLSYIDTNYAAENMVICAVGNIKHDDFVNMVTPRMSDYKAKVKFKADEQVYKGGFFSQRRDIEQSHVVLGFQSSSYHDDNHFAEVILSTILGGGMSSRLFQEIREKRGLVYSVYSFNSMYSGNGLFGIYAGTEAKDVPSLMPVVVDELKKVCQDLVTPKEFARAQTQIKAGLKMGLESSSSTAEVLARQQLMYGRTYSVAEIIAQYDAVSIDDVQKAAQRIFSRTPTYGILGAFDKFMDYDELHRALAQI